MRLRRPQHGRSPRAAPVDTLMATYVPYADIFVTDDARQLEYLKAIAVEGKLRTKPLVAHQLATAAGENGWAIGGACPLLLGLAGRRSPGAAGVRGDFAEDMVDAPCRPDRTGRGEKAGLKEGGLGRRGV